MEAEHLNNNAPGDNVSKDVLRRRNAEQAAYIERVNEQLKVVQRIAILAVAKLGGTMRIKEADWDSAAGADMQWRTVRLPSFAPEIHVACTLQGEFLNTPDTPPETPETPVSGSVN